MSGNTNNEPMDQRRVLTIATSRLSVLQFTSLSGGSRYMLVGPPQGLQNAKNYLVFF